MDKPKWQRARILHAPSLPQCVGHDIWVESATIKEETFTNYRTGEVARFRGIQTNQLTDQGLRCFQGLRVLELLNEFSFDDPEFERLSDFAARCEAGKS